MNRIQQFWYSTLHKRKIAGGYRYLKSLKGGVDFYSNDYLGLARNEVFIAQLKQLVNHNPGSLTGTTGSRLISGNTDITEETEYFIAQEHRVEQALLFPSGYKANLALFSCIAKRGDTIIVDELVHRSVHDGCMLSKATKWKFNHNDLFHLEKLLKKARGNIFIAVESLYSMDGDFAPIKEIVALARHYQALTIVDEAHATGVFVKGLVAHYGLQNEFLVSLVTYGKAFGLSGAVILGSHLLKEYLINYASPFIYSTAMPEVQILGIREAYRYLSQHEELADQLQENIHLFRSHRIHGRSENNSPIQTVQFASTDTLNQVSREMQKNNFHTYAVHAPTVALGSERLRICIHQFNTAREINALCSIIKPYL